jgi:hypothetical protein
MLLLAVVGTLTLTSIPAVASDNPEEAMQKPQEFKRRITKVVGAKYFLYLPKDYSPKSRQRWPLVLFLHGAGERGTNLALVAVHGPPKLVKQKREFPFIIVSPQCPDGETWSNDVLLGLLDAVMKKYRVDTNRVYLTGLSMGGYGTWSLGNDRCPPGQPPKIRVAENAGGLGVSWSERPHGAAGGIRTHGRRVEKGGCEGGRIDRVSRSGPRLLDRNLRES